MISQDSLKTAESGDTFGSTTHSIISKVSIASLAASGISGTSGWELERYLKELEEEEEDGNLELGNMGEVGDGGCGKLERGGTVKERAERLDRKISSLAERESGHEGIKGGNGTGLGRKDGFGSGGFIQQAKYGIRI